MTKHPMHPTNDNTAYIYYSVHYLHVALCSSITLNITVFELNSRLAKLYSLLFILTQCQDNKVHKLDCSIIETKEERTKAGGQE